VKTVMEGKVIILSAPSGCGKSTIIGRLFERGDLNMQFSVSATTRLPRGSERNGIEYFFLTEEDFRKRISEGDFLEYEEVYPGRFYGTLRSEVDRMAADGVNPILDIDVAGALRVKRIYGDKALCIFIMPPSVGELRHRLEGRGTDSAEAIEGRVAKAEHEIGYASMFDVRVVNDKLDDAVEEVHDHIARFLGTGGI